MDLPPRSTFHKKNNNKKCALPSVFKRFNKTLLYEQHAKVNVKYDVIAYNVKYRNVRMGWFQEDFKFEAFIWLKIIVLPFVVLGLFLSNATNFEPIFNKKMCFWSNRMSCGDPIWNLINPIWKNIRSPCDVN